MWSVARVFHWGPLIALSIIKCVTFTTLYMTSQWLAANQLFGAINYFFYYALIAVTLFNFFCAVFIGPGFLRPKWRPENENDSQYLQYCERCDGFKCPRAHHCRQCQRCVLKMDHHCPWINVCCGYRNHANFVVFLLSAVLGSVYSIVLLAISLYRAFHFDWYYHNDVYDQLVFISMTSLLFSVFSIGLSIGVIIAVGGLLIIQIKIIIRNQTSIEEWIVTKANSRTREKQFIYPYNIGVWNNIKQVLFEPTVNGITWPVKEGCDQYTLTVEQLLQKEEKRSRASLYRAIKEYNGRWFPLFSQGCNVCIRLPISDEPRIALSVGDDIVVTRWKKHWLYGEKMKTTNRAGERERGWFVRKCVVEIIKPNNNTSVNDKSNNCLLNVNQNNFVPTNKNDKKLN